MKRKIGELRNVPIVEGDKNLVRGGRGRNTYK